MAPFLWRHKCVTFYEHGAINGNRTVFDKMFESGKRVECFPNDARISREKVEKRNLNYLARKIDKTGSADPDQASDSGRRRSACRARTHENIQVVEELICSQEGQPIRGKGGHTEHHLD